MPAFYRESTTTRFQVRSAAKLGLPSAWLDGELNHLINLLNTFTSITQNISVWAFHAVPPTFSDSDTFTVAGDQTDVFTVGRAVRSNLNGTYAYAHVYTSSYAAGPGVTAVNLDDTVLTAALTEIYYSIIDATEAESAIPVTIARQADITNLQTLINNLTTRIDELELQIRRKGV